MSYEMGQFAAVLVSVFVQFVVVMSNLDNVLVYPFIFVSTQIQTFYMHHLTTSFGYDGMQFIHEVVAILDRKSFVATKICFEWWRLM